LYDYAREAELNFIFYLCNPFSKFVLLFSMFKRLLYYCLLLACILLFAVATTIPQSAWQHIGVNDGLTQGFVGAMLQDSRGFLWFGTKDGLSRYDGYTFKNYRPDPTDSTTITPDLVYALHECRSGLIWVGFYNGKVDIFDRKTEQFTHLKQMQPNPAEDSHLASIVEDTAGMHWVGRADGVFRIEQTRGSQKTNPIYSFHIERKDEFRSKPERLLSTVVTFVDRSGGVWIWSNGKLHLYNQSVHQIESGPREMGLDRNGIVESPDGTIFFFPYDSDSLYAYSYNPQKRSMVRLPLAALRLLAGLKPTIARDGIGNFFLIRAESVLRFSINSPEKLQIIKTPSILNPSIALFDSKGILWIGSSGLGIDRYNPAIERFGAIPEINFSRLAYQTMEKIGFPRHGGVDYTVTPYSDLYECLVFRDHTGTLWYPGDWGSDVSCYDPGTGVVKRFHRAGEGVTLTPGTLGSSPQVTMLEDNNGIRWFIGSSILSSFDDRAHGFKHYEIIDGELRPKLRSSNKMENFKITTARKDRDGSFWLCIFPQGLFRFDPVTLTLKRFSNIPDDTTSLSNNNVISMAEDPIEPGRYLWIGTDGGGLNKFEKSTGRCLRYSTRDGLPNNVIYTIFPDKKGNFWMSTNNGLCSMDPKTMAFHYYDVHDGLQGMEFNRQYNCQTPDGRIYLEGTAGMNVFYPEDIIENAHIPPVVFTDLKIHGNSVSWKDKDSPLKQSIVETKEIVLPFDKNILTIEFAALDFVNSGSNEYSYQLEGFSDEWTKPSKVNSATFTNLSPGKYTLCVRGSNNDGVWNQTGASISLTILPPWYRTWWAYTGYAGLFLTGLFLFRRYDLNRIRLKNQLEITEVKANQLKEVDQLKMQFFQNISHEFRTPLTLILGPIEKLLDDTVPEDTQKRELRMMRRNAQRLLRLINQLLDLSKLEAGGMKLQASNGNIVSFVKGVTMSFHSLAERKEIFLDVRANVEKLEVYFDKEKMEKVIINLLSNAFKFTPDYGEIIVSLALTPDPSPSGRGVDPAQRAGDGVRVSVRDTGIGIPPEKLSHIFDRFYQVDSSTIRAQEGTGIGLALVKELVTLHHGTITVTSEPGKGSEFVISLPLGKSHLKREEIIESNVIVDHHIGSGIIAKHHISVSEKEEILSGTQDGNEDNKPLLLVIEDNTDVREYIRSYLVPTYAVLEAKDGAEGVEKAKETIPDLIISDVMMPAMDGYEVCSRLKQDEKTSHVPIILLTAKAAKEDKIGGLETGADDYLIKPFDSSELLVRVKNLIESRRKLREKFGKEIVTLKLNEVAVNPVEQEFLKKVMDSIEKKIGDEQFGVNELAYAIGLSSKQLQRKLKGLANTTANDFIRSFRLQRAKELLQKDSATIAEVAYSVGFSSPAYFTKCFQEQFGTTPSEARKSQSNT
jgi:signal transduction histidine kinase/DNA-binding response OmpR family regulator/streptogramin lyase